MSTNGNNLWLQTSKYDEFQFYTLCGYNQKPILSPGVENIRTPDWEDNTKCYKMENGRLPNGETDHLVVMDPFFPEFVVPCSKRGDEEFRNMGKNAQNKIDFVCTMHG